MPSKKKQAPIRVGVVGLGRAGLNMHVPEMNRTGRKSKFDIVACADPLKAHRERFVEHAPCEAHSAIEDLIADDRVELVDIASRSPEHVEHAILALKAGKHVFLEKPIACDLKTAKKLIPAAKKARGKLLIRHNRRFEPAFNHIKEIMAEGLLGEVFEIQLNRHSYQRRDDWQTLMKCGGGQLLNWGPHLVDHGLRLLESPLKDLWSDLKKVAAVGDAEDHLMILMRGKNDRVVKIEISGGVALPQPVYVVFGTKGSLVSDEKTITMKYLDPKKKLKPRKAKTSSAGIGVGFGGPENLPWVEKTVKVSPKARCNTDSIWDHVYETIRNGKAFPIRLSEAMEVMEVIDQVKQGTNFNKPAKPSPKR